MNWDKEIEGFKEYLKLEKNLTSNSIHAYETDLKKLVSFLDEKGYKIGPEDIKLSHLKELMAWVTDKGISPRTQARIISGIKSFYKFLMIEEKVDRDPTALLSTPKIIFF